MVSRAASVLAVLLPSGFRDRQRDEWLGDLLALSEAGAGRGARLRYLMGAACTLPILRRQVRRGRSVGGLHGRLGRPGGRGVVWAAVFVSLVTGFLGACAAEAVAWSAAPGVPDLRSVAPVVFPGGSVQQARDSYMINPAVGWREYLTGSDGEDQYGVQSLWQSMPVTTKPGVWLDASRDRLEAAGWTVHGDGGAGYAHSFWATFYDLPAEHWVHLRTTNPIESTFATVRHRTKVTKGPGSKAAGLAMAFKLIEAAQQRWRAVNAPHLVALVRAGARFDRGKLVERPTVNLGAGAA